MAKKLPLVIALGTGYVLGTRAGRPQYERLRTAAQYIGRQPVVRNAIDSASAATSQFLREQGEVVTDKVAQAIKERLFTPPAATPQPEPVTVEDAEVRPA